VAQSTIKLIVDAQNAIVPLQRVNKQTQALSTSTDKLKGRLDRSSRSLNDTGRSAKVAATGFGTLTKSIAPLLKALAVIGAARFILFQTAQLETQTKALEVLTGSAETAQRIVQEIKEFGAVTPFKSSELIEVAKRMKAFGFETENVVDITKRIADIAGTAGAEIDGVALAIGKVQAKNKFMQEENIMLLEKGINVTKDLEVITGLSGEALAEAMSKGEIGADKFVEAIKRATSEGGQFFEGASKQSDTLAGKFSTFVDNVETFAQNLGKLFEQPLKDILDLLNQVAGEFNKIFGLLTDAQIGASNRAVGSASFKARFGMQSDAVEDITKAVELLDPTFVKTEEDAAKFFAQLDRISKVIKLVQGPDSAATLDARGLLEPLIEATNQMDTLRDRVNQNLAAQKQITLENKNTNKETSKITEGTKEFADTLTATSFAFTDGLVPNAGFFNENLDMSNVFLKDIFDGTLKISDSFKFLKTDADLLNDKFAQIGNTIATGVSDALVGAVMQTQSLAQAASSMLNDIASQLLRLGINTFLSSTFGGIFSSLDTFATGGRPPVGRPSIVGEKGPELFVPSTAGTIIPNNQLSGSTTNVVVNVDASGSAVEGDEDKGRELGRLISVAVQSELVQQKRPGGLLA
jgi:hypothetical protein